MGMCWEMKNLHREKGLCWEDWKIRDSTNSRQILEGLECLAIEL